MDWTYLGHAMWLAEAAGLRFLFDPQLGATHHAGVFEVFPRRTVDAEALRPDVIVVSHRHPDHFDLDSLARLAALDPETVVLTADVLCGQACQRLGFRHVSLLPDEQALHFEELSLFTTPSHCDVVEWGILMASADGTVWNQVDSETGSPQRVRETLGRAAAALERPDLADGIDFGIVRWQPLLEVEALIGSAPGFPHAFYGRDLDKVAACAPRTLVPGASGTRHAGPYAWLNRFAYPVSESRFLRDVARRVPAAKALPGVIGATYRLRGGEVTLDESGGQHLVEHHPAEDDRVFVPFGVPPLTDPNLEGHAESRMRAVNDAWIQETLAPQVGRAFVSLGHTGARLALEVVYPSTTDVYTLTVQADGVRIERRLERDYDMWNQIAGSMLTNVIEGRSHWGRPLLGGLLRASGRLYGVDEEKGLKAARVAPFFLYYALSYDAATERWIAWELEQRGV